MMAEDTIIRILRRLRWTAVGLIALLAIGVAILEFRADGEPATEDVSAGTPTISVPAGVPIGGPFHLIDDEGHNVTDLEYRGRWTLVFFGYTNCLDECPLTLQKMAAAMAKLGSLADRLAPLFITVDPARDTPARLASYLKNFDPRIVGLTGSDAQIAAAAKAYRVYYVPAEHEQSGADVVSHSTFLYLMNPAGQFDALLPSDVDAKKADGHPSDTLVVTDASSRPELNRSTLDEGQHGRNDVGDGPALARRHRGPGAGCRSAREIPVFRPLIPESMTMCLERQRGGQCPGGGSMNTP